jgi:hypothetical protein
MEPHLPSQVFLQLILAVVAVEQMIAPAQPAGLVVLAAEVTVALLAPGQMQLQIPEVVVAVLEILEPQILFQAQAALALSLSAT